MKHYPPLILETLGFMVPNLLSPTYSGSLEVEILQYFLAYKYSLTHIPVFVKPACKLFRKYFVGPPGIEPEFEC